MSPTESDLPAHDRGTAAATPEALVRSLLRLLDVEEIDTDLYRGPHQPEGRGRVYGGQVIAQALTSAMRSTEDGLVAHSLHAYFMRPGDDELPIVYRVVRDFEGRSFATRRIIALQRGRPILNMAASFQRPEDGFTHQAQMPDVPPPESLPSEAELLSREASRAGELTERVRGFLTRVRPIEMRPAVPWSLIHPDRREPRFMSWFRTSAPVGEDPKVHKAILAFASDTSLLGTSMMPHAVSWASPGMQTASLDHALWLHEDLRVDDWLLYVTDSPWAGHGRGFNRGQIFSRDGRLVASVAQEGLIRQRPV